MEKKNIRHPIDQITALKTAAQADFVMSFQIPVKKGGHILDAVFLYTPGHASVRPRPFASAVFDPGSGAVLSYCNCYIDDFVDTGKYPIGCKIDYAVPSAQTAREQGVLVKKVQELFPKIRLLPWKDRMEERERQEAEVYRESFYKASPKGLLPFYQGLSPEFFQWLDGLGAEHRDR